MGELLIALVGQAGYTLPVSCIIWGWLNFAQAKPRFSPPVWQSIAAFSGLAIASVVGLFALFVVFYGSRVSEAMHETFVLASCRAGFWLSAIAFLLSLLGKRPVRLPAALASVGLVAFWVIAVWG